MAKKSKAKIRPTFRQRLRIEAEERLDNMIVLMSTAGMRVCEEADTGIDQHDLMRLTCNRQTKSLRSKLVSELANEKEAAIENLYNNQVPMPLGADDD